MYRSNLELISLEKRGFGLVFPFNKMRFLENFAIFKGKFYSNCLRFAYILLRSASPIELIESINNTPQISLFRSVLIITTTSQSALYIK